MVSFEGIRNLIGAQGFSERGKERGLSPGGWETAKRDSEKEAGVSN